MSSVCKVQQFSPKVSRGFECPYAFTGTTQPKEQKREDKVRNTHRQNSICSPAPSKTSQNELMIWSSRVVAMSNDVVQKVGKETLGCIYEHTYLLSFSSHKVCMCLLLNTSLIAMYVRCGHLKASESCIHCLPSPSDVLNG